MNATMDTPLLALPAARLLAYDLALEAAAGVVDQGVAAEVLALLDRVGALTWRLIHPCR